MRQTEKSLQGHYKDGMIGEDGNQVVEIHSAGELAELLNQTTKDRTIFSVVVEVDGYEE